MNISNFFILAIGCIICIPFYSCSCDNSRRPTRDVEHVTVSETQNCLSQVEETLVQKPIVNVYIENSGSMYGYVNKGAEFKDIIYDYLSNVKISEIEKELNLFYINSEIIKQGPDVDIFIQNLGPNSFKKKGGNLGSTDISNLIKMVLAETTDNDISVIVSDFIFSPGRGKDADGYLKNQQIGIKKNFAEYLKNHSNTAVCVYQFFSKFDGYYYNRENISTAIKSNRPFYVWVVGPKASIKSLREKVDVKFTSNLKNSYFLEIFDSNVNYNVANSKYCRKIKSDPHACDVKKDKNGQISISVDVDLSNTIMDDSYLCNPENYLLSDVDMSISGIKRSQSTVFTHTITFVSNRVKSQTLSVSLKSNKPKWIEEYTDTVGLDINVGNSMNQTYGLTHLLSGVYEAFTFNGDEYFRMQIKIN